jgi:FMN phosphatase YigB (HAD superfamily)
MPLTLLIDLDDTILSNPLDKFMPAYLQLLSSHLAPFIAPEKMIPQLLKATDLMVEKKTPAGTLENTFDENFYPFLGLQKSNIKDHIDQFYREAFFQLKNATSPVPSAIELINLATTRHYSIAVATNPLFPLEAMKARLEWTLLPDSKIKYNLITSYESMHFAKPHSAYFAEILGTLGWVKQPVCMVGNSLKEDILPASEIGIPCYWVTQGNSRLPETISVGSSFGSLESAIPWMENLASKSSTLEYTSIPAILAILKSTPAVLETLTRALSSKDWTSRPEPTEWSVLEIISHMQDVEQEINLPRFHQLTSVSNPFLVGIDSDPWADERRYNETRKAESLSRFLESRIDLLKILSGLTPLDWQKPARHSIFGSTTLQEMAAFIVTHDQNHIRQISKTINLLV